MCLAVSVSVIMAGIPVQAAEFEAPADYESLFSSGEDSDYADDDKFESGTVPSQTISSVAASGTKITPTPTVTPVPIQNPTSDDSEISRETVTPTPTEMLTPVPTQTVTPVPTETPDLAVASVPDFDPEKEILIRYIDGEGKECTELEPVVVEWDKVFTLPHVPDQEAKDVWKLEQEESLDNSVTFDGGESVTLKKEESWDEFLKDGVLYLYMPQKYTVCLYNNSGTSVFPSGEIKVYEGNDVTLPDIAGTLYINYGWTDIPGSAEVKYPLNFSYRITKDQNFYIIRRASLQMTFLSQNGKTSSAFQALNLKIGKGLTFQIPDVPEYPGYQNLGWSLKKNASQADYQAGQTIKASKNLTLYAVRKKYPYKVIFNNNSSTSTAYTSLTMYAFKNDVVTLPELPKASGYQNLGWTTVKNSTTPLYEAGSQMKITKNTRLYAVRKKNQYYTVQFKRGDGATSAAYKQLSVTVEEGTTITFPAVPARSGYVNIGWSSRKNSATATKKTQYTVSRNITFYAVQKKEVQVILHKNNGAVYSTVAVEKGGTYELPGVRNASGYTFMGWSTKPMQSVNPEYEAEETITVNKTIDLYAVVFNRSTETGLSADDLPQVNFYKYKKVIFVGDSRTQYMQNVLNALDKNVISNTEFICEAGKGLSWMRSTGYAKLYKLIENDSNSILGRKTAVIFNLGVNDMQNYKEYVAYYNMIAPILEKHGCELYFMSVNPINRKMLPNANRADRSEATLRNFNEYLQKNLTSAYNYIDMYSYLKQNGYSFAKDSNGVSTVDDGLHYTAATYKRIYAQCLKSLKGY